jgi:hypothetical protein
VSGHFQHSSYTAEHRERDSLHVTRGMGESKLFVELTRDLNGPQERWDTCPVGVPVLSETERCGQKLSGTQGGPHLPPNPTLLIDNGGELVRCSGRDGQVLAGFQPTLLAVDDNANCALKGDEVLRLNRVVVLWGRRSTGFVGRLHHEHLR